jgi:hypothetical protein
MDARKLIDPTQWPRPKLPKLFKRVNDPYRLVFIDDATLEEVASFRLTKKRVWAAISFVFILTIVVTVCILLFSPLKYYIPGYGNGQTRGQVLRLQQTVDSLGDLITAQQRQAERIELAIAGPKPIVPDTTPLSSKEIERAQSEGTLPSAEAVQAAALPPQPARRGRRRR